MANRFYLLLIFTLAALPCLAQEETESVELIAPAEDTEANNADAKIKAYLETIFANVDDLKEVDVAVKNGVVRLGGQTSGDTPREKAESVAKEIDGVVYVDNDIVTTKGVSEQLSPRLKRVHQLFDNFRALLPMIAIGIAILILTYFLSRLAAKLFERLGFFKSNLLLRNILANLLRAAVMLFGLYIALEVVGATKIVGAMLGAAGVVGLAVSFAFRDIIENYLASVILSLRQPFRIKDRVEINGHVGRVIRLTSSETLLMTDDGNHFRLPNAEVFKGTITNFSRNPRRRLNFNVGIGNEEDLVAAEEIGLAALNAIEGILDDPKPSSSIIELADSSVTVGFFAWVDQTANDFGKVKSFAIRRVKEAFDEASVAMPSPTFEVNMHDPDKQPAPKPAPAPKQESGKAVDLSPDTHIDSQIDAEQASAKDENLLS